jgi:hypothetical protein
LPETGCLGVSRTHIGRLHPGVGFERPHPTFRTAKSKGLGKIPNVIVQEPMAFIYSDINGIKAGICTVTQTFLLVLLTAAPMI